MSVGSDADCFGRCTQQHQNSSNQEGDSRDHQKGKACEGRRRPMAMSRRELGSGVASS